MQQKLLNAEHLWQPSTLGHYHNTCTGQANGLKISKNHLLQLFVCVYLKRQWRKKKGQTDSSWLLI